MLWLALKRRLLLATLLALLAMETLYLLSLKRTGFSPDVYMNNPKSLAGYLVQAERSDDKQARLLCLVLTSAATAPVRLKAIMDTWSGKCDKALYMSGSQVVNMTDVDGLVNLNTNDSYKALWQKTKAAWLYVYLRYVDEFEWFLKTDDDTFVIVENLRYYLSELDPGKDHYLGRYFEHFGDHWQSGGAGYVLSRRTLERLGNHFARDRLCGGSPTTDEDIQISRCLKKFSIVPGDTRHGIKDRFHPFPAHRLLIDALAPKGWFTWVHYNTTKQGPDCCSELSISFHYIKPHDMYALNYYIYHLHPYGSFKTDLLIPPPGQFGYHQLPRWQHKPTVRAPRNSPPAQTIYLSAAFTSPSKKLKVF